MELTSELETLQNQLAQVELLTTPSRSSRASDISFLLLKRGRLKFKMYQEPWHSPPHIHIDYEPKNYVVNYRIDLPSRII